MNTETKHTPGPWTIEESTIDFPTPLFVTINGADQFVVNVCGYSPEKVRANSRLIAAAPDLLEALEGLLDITQDIVPLGSFGDKARAAIAKATGQES